MRLKLNFLVISAVCLNQKHLKLIINANIVIIHSYLEDDIPKQNKNISN